MCFVNVLLVLISLGPWFFTQAFRFTLGDCLVLIDEPCDTDSVRFFLSTPVSFTYRSTLHLLDPTDPVLPPHFNKSIPIKILIHGYGGLAVDAATRNVSKAYQVHGYNVIIGITPNTLHAVGFSLGAHVAGFASNYVRAALGEPFWRITGLDPALPFFATLASEWKLDRSDAEFVDVVHTSAGSFGKIEAAGDVDFYMNGGYLQPVCLNASCWFDPPLCSHGMAGLYFAESIASRGFVGTKCHSLSHYFLGMCPRTSLAVMGEHVHPQIRGLYFVETSDSPPFALGNYKHAVNVK